MKDKITSEKNEDMMLKELKDPVSEYQEKQWEKPKNFTRRLERYS